MSTVLMQNAPVMDPVNGAAIQSFVTFGIVIVAAWALLGVLWVFLIDADIPDYCTAGRRHQFAESEPWQHHCLYDVCGCTFEVCVACERRKHTSGGTFDIETLGYAVREKEPPTRGRKGWEHRPGRFADTAEAEAFRATLVQPDLFEVVLTDRPGSRLSRTGAARAGRVVR